MNKPKVIVLCGSTKYCQIMAVVAWLLERDEGVIVVGPQLLPYWYSKGYEVLIGETWASSVLLSFKKNCSVEVNDVRPGAHTHTFWMSPKDDKGLYSDTENIPDHLAEHENVKDQLDEFHMRKIDLADEVFVVNYDDYIGNSTSREVEYAIDRGLPIRWYNGPGSSKKEPVATLVDQMIEDFQKVHPIVYQWGR